MRFSVSCSYIYVPDEINKIVIDGFKSNTQSNTETDKYGQKQSIKFATFKTPEITRNQDWKVNCVLLCPYIT